MFVLSGDQKRGSLQTYNGFIRFVDLTDKTKPVVYKEYKCDVGLPYVSHWHPSNNYVICTGAKTYLEVIDLSNDYKNLHKSGHDIRN